MANSVQVQQALERYARAPSLEGRNAVVDAMRYLCTRAARRFERGPGDRRDFEHVAVIGLIKACERYRGLGAGSFEHYAWRMIVGELMHYVRDLEGVVRIPRRVRTLERRYSAAYERLAAAGSREPSTADVAGALGLARTALDDVRRLRCGPAASLFHEPVAATASVEERVTALAAVEALPERERTVVMGVYGLGLTQDEVAKRMRISQRHVSRLHSRALQRMTHALV